MKGTAERRGSFSESRPLPQDVGEHNALELEENHLLGSGIRLTGSAGCKGQTGAAHGGEASCSVELTSVSRDLCQLGSAVGGGGDVCSGGDVR